MIKMVKDVLDFSKRCRYIVSGFESDMFDIGCYLSFDRHEVNSPIEQILFYAISCLCKTNFIDTSSKGLSITPQFKIDKYRVDFLITYNEDKKIIVECDSQQFHDRTEKERRKEKERDRYLIKNGYKTFHFTGSEITQKPFETAAEIVSYLTEKEYQEVLDGIINYDCEEE
jgi:Uncharacterized protein conserved in bacteria